MAGNGNLDPSTLRILPGFLPYAAANNFHPVTTADQSNMILNTVYTDAMNMAADFQAACHQELTYAEAYRPLHVQQWRIDEHAKGGPTAAAYGDSNHGWALAVDYRNGIGGGPGNTTYQWMADNAAKYGFFNDVNGEYWHWHHPSVISLTTPRTTTASTGTETLIGDEDMPLNDADKIIIGQIVNDKVLSILRAPEFASMREGAADFLNATVDPNSNPPVGKVYQALRDSRQGTFGNQSILKLIAKKLGIKL